jgi:hypothetical protein
MRGAFAAAALLALGIQRAVALPPQAISLELPRGFEKATLWQAAGSSGRRLPLQLGDSRSAVVETSVACGSEVFFIAVAGHRTASARAEPNANCSAPLQLREFPTTPISGVLTLPSRQRSPDVAVALAVRCAQGPLASIATIHGRRLEIRAPSGCEQVRLLIGDFLPFIVSGSELNVASRDLGIVRLSTAARARIRVVDAAGEPLRNVRVAAVIHDDLVASRVVPLDFKKLTASSALTDPQGWARLSNLPPGEVVFAASAPGSEFGILSDAYEIDPAHEMTAELRLPPLAALNVRTTAAVGLTAVLFRSRVDDNTPRLSFEIPATRLPRIEGIPPGVWSVRAAWRYGGGAVLSPEKVITLGPGSEEDLIFDLPLAPFHGGVTRANEPIAGWITFRRDGDKTAPTSVPLAADGAFEILLAGAGSYRVRVDQQDGSSVTLRDLARLEPDQALEIALPPGRLIGSVVDSTGHGAAGAVIAAENADGQRDQEGIAYTRSGPDGHFVLTSIEPGPWRVTGEKEGETSDSVLVVSDGTVNRVDLQLRSVRKVVVRVITAGGTPITAAAVVATPLTLDDSGEAMVNFTDGDGQVELTVPSSTRELNFAVRSPDNTIATSRNATSEAILIAMPAASGSLVLKRSSGWPASYTGRLVAIDGSFFGPALTGTKNENSMIIPRLPPGTWKYFEPASVSELHSLEARPSLALGSPLAFATVTPGAAAEMVIQERPDSH